jgi:hypothetical protein
MRNEINDLGIDPIQVFGFAREHKKNAADIQLAIDAIDLAHIRPAIDIFVVVSGDGGFAALAKKLHEYGKTVIGCAYRNATNRTFHAVCDHFVWITDPEEEERSAIGPGPSANLPSHPEVTDPRNHRLVAKIRKCNTGLLVDVLTKTREILTWYANDSVCRGDLSTSGIYLNVIQEGVKACIPGFSANRYGFAKFLEYMQHACKGTTLCVARPPHSQAMLLNREAIREYHDVSPDLELRELHAIETYRLLLAVGTPPLRLPAPVEFDSVLRWLLANPPDNCDAATLLDAATRDLGPNATPENVKCALMTLVHMGIFQREPEGGLLFEQRLTLPIENRTLETIREIALQVSQKKLQGVLGEVREPVLRQLFEVEVFA